MFEIDGEHTDAESVYTDEQLAVNLHDQEFGKEYPKCGKKYARRKQKCNTACCNNAMLKVSKRQAEDPPETYKKKVRTSITRHKFLPSSAEYSD